MGADETGTLSRLKALRQEVFEPKTKQHGGRIFKTTGDGALVEFASAVGAVRSAIDIQRAVAERDADVAEGELERLDRESVRLTADLEDERKRLCALEAILKNLAGGDLTAGLKEAETPPGRSSYARRDLAGSDDRCRFIAGPPPGAHRRSHGPTDEHR